MNYGRVTGGAAMHKAFLQSISDKLDDRFPVFLFFGLEALDDMIPNTPSHEGTNETRIHFLGNRCRILVMLHICLLEQYQPGKAKEETPSQEKPRRY
jgi:hypothetical protein